MKRILYISLMAVFFVALCASAQVSPQIQGAGAPTNPCFNGGQQYVDQTNHVIYSCPSNGSNWALIGLGNTQNNTNTSAGSGVPSGNCSSTNQFFINTTNGNLYTCPTPGSPWVLTGDTGSATPVLWTGFGTGNATAALVQNTVGCIGFVSGPYGGTYSRVAFDINTADNTSNSYDLGISNATTGALVCHTGATAGTSLFPATGIKDVPWAASCTLAPNTKYYVVLTSSAASPAAKLGGNLTPSFQTGNTCGSSTSAAIPNPLNTVPSDSYAQAPIPALALHN